MVAELRTSALLPSSLAADAPDLKQKTLKVGAIGRALAIFRVGRVCIYDDSDPNVKDQEKERELIATLLSYIETPQYLRKLMFPQSPALKYAGLLPPLRTPHHPLKGERSSPGSFREGVVVKTLEDHSLAEIGLEKKAIVEKLGEGTRCTIEITGEEERGFVGRAVPRSEVPDYWGFEISSAGGLREGLGTMKADYRLGTSRLGSDLYGAIENIRNSKVSSLAVAFGGPYSGLFEICRRQGVEAGDVFDAVVNTIPGQGTATVRTEESLLATLALLNLLLRK